MISSDLRTFDKNTNTFYFRAFFASIYSGHYFAAIIDIWLHQSTFSLTAVDAVPRTDNNKSIGDANNGLPGVSCVVMTIGIEWIEVGSEIGTNCIVPMDIDESSTDSHLIACGCFDASSSSK